MCVSIFFIRYYYYYFFSLALLLSFPLFTFSVSHSPLPFFLFSFFLFPYLLFPLRNWLCIWIQACVYPSIYSFSIIITFFFYIFDVLFSPLSLFPFLYLHYATDNLVSTYRKKYTIIYCFIIFSHSPFSSSPSLSLPYFFLPLTLPTQDLPNPTYTLSSLPPPPFPSAPSRPSPPLCPPSSPPYHSIHLLP